jgi:hypothetical protein
MNHSRFSIVFDVRQHAEPRMAAALATLGFAKLKDWEGAAIGFGKKYPEFRINKRETMGRLPEDSGVHICLRRGGHGISGCLSRGRAQCWRRL